MLEHLSTPYKGFFISHRDIRQGDRLSFYLFVLVMVFLSNMFREAEILGWIRRLNIGRNDGDGMILNHILLMTPSCIVKLIKTIFYI